MTRFLAGLALAVASLLSVPASAANSWGTDMSDLWWNPAENGWGANLVHQGEIVFLTMYVYGPDSKPRWYVGSGLVSIGGSTPYTFRGELYETTGPYFASSFNPALVNNRPVGTATVAFTTINRGTLTYSVDGTNVTKTIERLTFRMNSLAGTYLGAAVGTATGCGSTSGNFALSAQFAVSHSGTSASIAATLSNGAVCTYSGTYSQAGRMGAMVGNLSCTNGARATYQAYEIESSYQGFFLRYDANWGGGCTESGRIGGLKQ